MNITDNLITIESFKSIWMLLEVNPEIVIYFDKVEQQIGQKKQNNRVAVDISQELSYRDEEALTSLDDSRVKLRKEK